MTTRYLLYCLAAGALALGACKKDKNNPRGPEVLISGITASMAGADSISAFTAALQNLSLTAEETREGITIFAPLNETLNVEAVAVKRPGHTVSEAGPSSAKLPDAFMKDHIVKGVYKLADLIAGKSLTTLGGNKLTVVYRDNKLVVNGILISGTDVATTAHGVVHVVRASLEGSQFNADTFTEDELVAGMRVTESSIAEWHRSMVMLDGFLSHDAEAASVPGSLPLYQRIGNFQFGPADQVILQLWQIGYSWITALNTLEKRVKNAIVDQHPWLSRIRATRAFVYLQLLTYYENIPLTQTPIEGLRPSNADPSRVHNFIRSELEAAIPLLPSASSAADQVNSHAAKVLLARYYLLRKEYQQVLALTGEVITSGRYALATSDQIFSFDREIIWDHSAPLSAVVKSYFFDRDRLPYIRLAEVYLMNAEANFNLGNDAAARTALSVLLQRRGAEQADVTLGGLKEFWRVELQREGLSFPALRRWDKAAEVLGQYGFVQPKHNRLPIPALEVNLAEGLAQNEGY